MAADYNHRVCYGVETSIVTEFTQISQPPVCRDLNKLTVSTAEW